MQTGQNGTPLKNDSFDVLSILKEYRHYWKLFIALITLSLLVALVIYLTTSPKYSVTSSIILKENDNMKGGGLASLEDLGLISTTSNIDNEIAIFKSPDLMSEVVRSLEVQTSIFENTGLRDVERYKDSPFTVSSEGIVFGQEEYVSMDVNFEKDGSLLVKGTLKQKGEKLGFDTALVSLPGYVNLPNNEGRLLFSRTENELLGTSYRVKVRNVIDVSLDLVKQLTVTSETKSASVLNMSILVGNKKKGEDILSELVRKYNEDNVRENNQIAFNTSVFIDERLKDISLELGSVEGEVEMYKQGHGITNLTAETQLYMQQTAANDQRKLEIETQLGVVSMVEAYVNKSSNKGQPIPNIGITDSGLVGLINQYNEKLLKYEDLEASVGENNPMKRQLQQELNQMFINIQESLQNVRKSMTLTKTNIDKQNSEIENKIKILPKQERGLLERMRQQQIKENLYLFLLQKREETSITMAATSDKAKIIVKPRVFKRESPNAKHIFLFSILIGVFLSAAIVYVKSLLRITIVSRKELESLSIVPVLGQITKKDTTENIVVAKGESSSLVELFRNLRNSIGFMLGSHNKYVLMVTSTIAGEGKSFIGSNLAASFALNSKRVLIMGLDIRNPQLANNFDLPNTIGVTSYLNGDVDDWRELVKPYSKQSNLHVLQAGVVPPNPNELLMTPRLAELVDEAREEYDVVILDTAPVGIISDTYLLSKLPDLTLYIVREGYTHKDSVDFINQQKENDRLPNIYIVLNDVDPSKENYRYGYGKAYGYGK